MVKPVVLPHIPVWGSQVPKPEPKKEAEKEQPRPGKEIGTVGRVEKTSEGKVIVTSLGSLSSKES